MSRRCIVLAVLATLLMTMVVTTAPAAALVRNGSHGWYWQLPQPAGGYSGMVDVAYAGDGDVWTVGEAGLLMHSTDGGRTWAVQPSITDHDLWSIFFADPTHGFACGDGVVIATGDGGISWSEITPPAGFGGEYWSVCAADASRVWVSTGDGGVLRTVDAGATWTRHRFGASVEGVAVDFVGANRGWAAADGGRLWRTTDGGVTWRPLRPTGLDAAPVWTQIDFWDARHGWLWGYRERDESMVVLTTSDGGAHWRTAYTGWWVDDLVASGPSSAWMLYSGYSFWGEPTELLHTSDAGRHWTTEYCGMPAAPSQIAARGDAICAVGAGILVSEDGGRTIEPASSGQAYMFRDMDAVAGDDIWAVEYAGAVLHSTDGVRWSELDVPQRWSCSLEAVDFPDAQNGWLVGSNDDWGESGVILRTADGGVTWEPQFSNLSGSLSDVDFVDASTGWAVSDNPYSWGEGANTCLERTTDGGETWVPLFVAGGAALDAVDFIDTQHGWAAGRYGATEGNGYAALFSSANGGFTWKRHPLPKDAPTMTGLQFIDADNGWAVGVAYDWKTEIETGWTLRTTDGGATWTRVHELDDAVPYVVHFADALHGYVGGDDGIWSTSDGGATWSRVAGGYGVEAITSAGGSVWAAGGQFLTSTVDATGDTAAPVTLDRSGFPSWSRHPVRIDLTAGDIGGSGLAGTAYRVDGETAWRSGSTVIVPAPPDHSNDGAHTVYYRSIDNAGNREQLELRSLGIDTLGPACSVYRDSVVDSGSRGNLYFRALDASSGVARATLTVRDRAGDTVLKMRLKRGNWGTSPTPKYYWWPFACKLQPGRYRLEVRATDRAGNRQLRVGRGELRVVRSGAPKQRQPRWPAGLPYDAGGYGARQGLAASGALIAWRPALVAIQAERPPVWLHRTRSGQQAH